MGDGNGHNQADVGLSPGALDALFGRPTAWDDLDPNLLCQLLVYQCLSRGTGTDDAVMPRLAELTRVAAARLHPAVRLQIVLQVARAVERMQRQHDVDWGAGGVSGLLPFLLEDPDPSVVSAAACELAILLPLEHDDPLTGPNLVASLIDQVDLEDARAGIIAGLLLLGDERLEGLLDGAWRRLGLEGRQTLALLIQGFHGLHLVTVRFLLGWLEGEAAHPEAPTFGVVAATMARAGRHAAEHGVVAVRRAFPVTAAPEGRPYEVVREWPLHQFLPLVSERLLGLTSVEHPPELLLSVLRHWGLGE
jgi:hypothetical protein